MIFFGMQAAIYKAEEVIMPRKKLPRTTKSCERKGCNNEFTVVVGAKYQPKYCCSRCAALATVSKRKKRRARNTVVNQDPVSIRSKRAVTLEQLQNFPINHDDINGGKFAEMVSQILNGEMMLIGF